MNHDKPIQQVWEVQFLEGWKWYLAMYWALNDLLRIQGRRLLLQIELPPMWGGARVRSPARKRRGRGHRRGRGGADRLPALGEAAAAAARRFDDGRLGGVAGACCSAGGAEVHGDEPRTWASTGAGRGPGGGGVGGDGMKTLHSNVAIEIADRGWKIYRVLNILLWRVKFRGYHYR
ncbi:hypothetical protein PVAP13_6NG110500 [Panicum virgatum]|uniref:Uncharacterized protein n=1 Tax=Panicum virgatum TaxID=38727 RepID=A0A8T0R0D7_PANVG|nr:hypothetical protein PVAP13_6NG110500 [Panicum virgatum]